jgi:DNA-binding Lrp family transcriptional regulator
VNMRPQDVLVVLKLSSNDGWDRSYAALAEELGLSASEVHAAIRRLIEARLLDPETKKARPIALRNFLVHGVPYVFPVRSREVTTGMPTGWAAPAMEGMVVSGDQLPPVWPDPEGEVQGVSVRPLYSSVARAARRDSKLYAVVSVKFRTFGDRQCRRKVLSFGLGYAAGGVPGAGTKIYESI